MTLTRANAPGWPTGARFTSTQANHMDAEIPKAIDGVGGGTYTPSAPIDVTGANGFGDVDFTGNVNFASGGTVSFADDATWSGASNLPKLGSRSYVYTQSMISAAGDSEWISISVPGYRTNNNATTYQLYLNLDNLPYLGTITAITAYVDPKNGHGGLPGTMPRLKLSSRTHGSVGDTDVAQQTDTSANVAAYEALHTITLSGLSATIDGTKMYYVEVQSEGGANALDFFQLMGLTVTCTVTQIAP